MADCKLLLVSGDVVFAAQLGTMLGDAAEFLPAETVDEAASLLSSESPQLLVADFRDVRDGGHAGDRFLESVQELTAPPTVILITSGDCPEPLERRAACSDMAHFRASHDTALIEEAVQRHLTALSAATPAAGASESETTDPEFTDAVIEGVTQRFETNSSSFRRMLEDLAIAAAHDVTILLIGETGSGKTYLSQLIHEASPRRDEPFIHVACGALPRELIESELFGHAKGAFTSAHADKQGKFLAAAGGTILLDEIDVLGPEQQVKLLRVIETREFEPVGSNTTHKSRARLVVASNLDLQPLVEQGKFRPDLYYRLNMLKFDIPPLRKRKMDIVPLARKFIAKFTEQHGTVVNSVEDRFFDGLLAYPWPGNVRELEHVVQRAVIYCRDERLQAEQLPPHILLNEAGPVNDPSVKLPNYSASTDTSLEAQVAVTERELIEDALMRNNFSRTNTAKDLGISRVTLYNKMKRYKLMK